MSISKTFIDRPIATALLMAAILLAGILIDRGAWWGLDFVRDAIVPGQVALQADVPLIRDHLLRHGSSPEAAVAGADVVLGHWVDLHAQLIGYRRALRF